MNIAIFFCQQLDPEQDVHRRALEKELGTKIRFFPMPCSGRIEAIHLLRAVEAGADLVYLITCPEGVCRYQEGNVRAGRRLTHARRLIREIGLEPSRLRLVVGSPPLPLRIDELVRGLLSGDSDAGPCVSREKVAVTLAQGDGLLPMSDGKGN